MTDTFDADRYAALKRHEAHEQTLPEGQSPIEVTEIDGSYFYDVIDKNTNWSVSAIKSKSVFYLCSPSGNDLSIHPEEIQAIIALLQRAQSIIEGDAS